MGTLYQIAGLATLRLKYCLIPMDYNERLNYMVNTGGRGQSVR